jgi:hypothetical protein
MPNIQNPPIESGAHGAQPDNPPVEPGAHITQPENPPLEPGSGRTQPPASSKHPGMGGAELNNPPAEPGAGGEPPNPSLELDTNGAQPPMSPAHPVSGAPENPPLEPSGPGGSASSVPPSPTERLRSRRQLVVVVKRDAGLEATRSGITSSAGADVGPLQSLLAVEGVTLEPLFWVGEDRPRATAATRAVEVPDLSVYFRVDAPDERLDELASRLQELDVVEAAYVKPPAEPALMQFDVTAPPAQPGYPMMLRYGPALMQFNAMAPRAEEAPAASPDYTSRQGYLKPATLGVDAPYAWTLPGGSGAGVNVIDIEWGWRFTHEDLLQSQGGVISGTNSSDSNHGTAVIGEIGGDRNSFGVVGISPDAVVRSVSLVTHDTSEAIHIAANHLSPGDIILLEVHRPGPRASQGSGQFGYIAIEWWPDDFDAIRYAVGKGIIVVEAAGNGGQNLDDAIYDTRPGNFPPSWRNPFNPPNPSSDAVVVGAGMPPSGTHGRNFQPGWGDVYADRGRCFFSNYGARVDAQGWGWEVTTTGYGDLQGGADADKWYTDQFSGTSSASPILVGTLACVEGVLRAGGKPLLTSARARRLLRATGSPQEDAPGFTFIPPMTGSGYSQNHPPRPRTQRIGNRPNLRQLIARALKPGGGMEPIYELLLLAG